MHLGFILQAHLNFVEFVIEHANRRLAAQRQWMFTYFRRPGRSVLAAPLRKLNSSMSCPRHHPQAPSAHNCLEQRRRIPTAHTDRCH